MSHTDPRVARALSRPQRSGGNATIWIGAALLVIGTLNTLMLVDIWLFVDGIRSAARKAAPRLEQLDRDLDSLSRQLGP